MKLPDEWPVLHLPLSCQTFEPLLPRLIPPVLLRGKSEEDTDCARVPGVMRPPPPPSPHLPSSLTGAGVGKAVSAPQTAPGTHTWGVSAPPSSLTAVVEARLGPECELFHLPGAPAGAHGWKDGSKMDNKSKKKNHHPSSELPLPERWTRKKLFLLQFFSLKIIIFWKNPFKLVWRFILVLKPNPVFVLIQTDSVWL